MITDSSINISVVIPVYNCEKYLSDCLDSILAQTYPYWTAYCVDDGSTDDSGKILDRYANTDDRIKVFQKTNGGAHTARNYALDQIEPDSYKWISFVDCDDYISPFMFEHVVKVLENVSDPNCQYIRLYCQRTPDAMDANEAYQCLYRRSKGGYNFETEELDYTIFDNDGYFANGNCGGQISSAFIHSELIDQNNCRIPEDMMVLEDQAFTMTCATKSRVIVDYKFEDYFYRYNPLSLTNSLKDSSGDIVRCVNYVYSAFKESGLTEGKRNYLFKEYIPDMIKALLVARFKNAYSTKELPPLDADINLVDYLYPIKYKIIYYYLKYFKHSIF